MNKKILFIHSLFSAKAALKVINLIKVRFVLGLMLAVLFIPGISSADLLGLAGYSISDLAVNPQNPSIVYAGITAGQVARSTDGGVNWEIIEAVSRTTNAVTEVEIHPSNPNIVYASGFSLGFRVYRSADGGTTWTNPFEKCGEVLYECSASGFPTLAVGTPDVIYAGARNGSDGVYKSVDGGKNWIITNMRAFSVIRDLAIDPASPSTVYAAVFRAGVYKSTDAGINWVAKNNGLTDLSLNALVVDPKNPSTIYVGGSGGFSKSTDGGESWTDKNNGMPYYIFVDSIIIDPKTPSTIYVGTVTKGEIYKTTDGGENWTLINVGLEEMKIQHVEIDPKNPSTVYAGTDKGVYRSDDSGATWVHPPPELPLVLTADSSANLKSCGKDGEPVNTYSGELFSKYQADIDLGGPMPLKFERYYASYLRRSFIAGDLGSNWRHNFDARLFIPGTMVGGNIIAHYVSKNGRVTKFLKALNTDVWVQDTNLDTPYQLIGVGGQDAKLYDPEDDKVYTFDFTTSSTIIGKLASVQDGHGNVHTLTYDLDNGHIKTISDGLGRTLTLTYNTDAVPKIETVSDGTRKVYFHYTDSIDSEYLTRFTNVLGDITTYTYEDTSTNADQALLTSQTLPNGNVPYAQTFYGTDNQYSSGRVAEQTDSDGNVFSFVYSGSDTTITDPLGNSKKHSHTDSGELKNIQDEDGNIINVGSNATKQRNSITDRLGDVTSYDYHAESGNMSSVTNTDGGTSNFIYTARVADDITFYDLTTITHADSSTDSFSYDGSGNPTSQTDRGGYQSTFTYNGNAQVLSATNPAGGVSVNTYNVDGTQATSYDPAGNETSYSYDPLKRPSSITHEDNSTVGFTYDDNNNVLAVTNENSHITSMGYDANSNLSTITNPLGYTTVYSYDGNDRQVSVTDPMGASSSTSYDELGRVKSNTGKNNNVTTYGYDAIGRLTSTTDPGGNQWTKTYDAEGIIASSTDPLTNTTAYSSDTMGRITRITSPLGHSGTVTYDIMGQVATTTDPMGNKTTFTRDSRSLLTGASLPGGTIRADYTRNELGRITEITDPNGNIWPRSYDNMGRLTATGDPVGNSSTIAYDGRNRPSLITYTGLGTLTMGYDSAGNLTERAYSDGTTLTNSFDANNRMTSGTGIAMDYDANNRVSDSNGITISRDAGGRITSMTVANGKVISYSYDANDQLTQVTDWAGGISDFTYDAAGRLISVSRPNGIDTTNTYDEDNRLTGISEGTVSSISLTRDGMGQITGATRDVPQVASARDLASQSRTFDAASQVSGYTYDELGRRTADEEKTYDWDLASRLTSYTQNTDTTSFTYDASGRQLSRTSKGTTRDYVWNYALGISSVSVVRQDGGDIRYYVHSPGGALLYSIEASDNSRRFYHYDERGNTSFVSDDSQSIIGQYAYTPFGRLISSDGDLDNPFTWQGKHGVMDEGNDLYYIRSRYYDSASGRFISRDPKRSINPKSVNPYQYAWNNPMLFGDRTGMNPFTLDDFVLGEGEGGTRIYDPHAPGESGIADTDRGPDMGPKCKEKGGKGLFEELAEAKKRLAYLKMFFEMSTTSLEDAIEDQKSLKEDATVFYSLIGFPPAANATGVKKSPEYTEWPHDREKHIEELRLNQSRFEGNIKELELKIEDLELEIRGGSVVPELQSIVVLC